MSPLGRGVLEPSGTELTALLQQAANGSAHAQDLLFQLLVPRLREMAAARMAHEKPGHTLSPTGLVNEAYLRLAKQHTLPSENLEQFLGTFGFTMRRVLVDHWKRKNAAKNGGGWARTALDHLLPASPRQEEEWLAVHTCLEKLERARPRQAKVIELRFFGGLSNPEIAASLDISVSTVEADWRFARAWLRSELKHL